MIEILLVIIVVAVLLWLIETYLPMDPNLKTLIRFLVALFLVLWLLRTFGLLSIR